MGDLNYRIDGLADEVVHELAREVIKMHAILATTVETKVLGNTSSVFTKQQQKKISVFTNSISVFTHTISVIQLVYLH
jgi:hypothetical protein